LQSKKHRLRQTLESTEDQIRHSSGTVLADFDLLARPDALFISADDEGKRTLLAAFFAKVWVCDDGSRTGGAANGERRPRREAERRETERAPEKSPTPVLIPTYADIALSCVRV